MLLVSKWILIVAGLLLVLDAAAIVAGVPNPLFGWPMPCPITLALLGIGLVLFCLASAAFRRP
ncbi:MAG TPA: hypothetical protein P5567_02785 [Kiritimatiellia bacterium]|nr:hypothetical protein [Kiritimatiellia bacterium]HRZ11359.1 hypothetical protein [Kiritimatiellia bacterium]HSA17090.1 hypothetical protein [Kiritimatiellia bacterium]